MKHFLLILLVLIGSYAAIRVSPPALRRQVGGFILRHASPILVIVILSTLAFAATVLLGPTTILAP
jgi:hypothetical protein